MQSLKEIEKRIKKKIKRIIEKDKNKWPKDKLVNEMTRRYSKRFNTTFDVNNPVLFTEKIQWYKLFYKNELLPRIVDKYEFKQFIRERLGDGYTIPLYALYNSFSEFKKGWNQLPEEFCLKSTVSGSGKNIIIIHHKSEENYSEIMNIVKQWFDPHNTLINSFEIGYHDCKARVIAEEYMENIDEQLFDYKIFCFEGRPYCIYAASEHFKSDDFLNGYPISFYDLTWNKLDVKYGNHRNDDIPPPKHLDEMINHAVSLSKGFPFVRVDFFDTDDKLYLAEMTFYPGGGMTKYEPESFNKELGELFHLPNEMK